MDDDYVAQVLAKEARDSSQKYSTEGVGAYMPRKPAGNAPKPNTRFLRHLIKETDSHNTALKRKEEGDAKKRMQELKGQTTAASKSTSRRGHHLDRARDSEKPGRDDRKERHRSSRRRHRSRSTSTDRDRSRRHRRRDEDTRDRHRDTDRERTERRRERHRHESSRKDRRERERSYSRSRSRSPRKERSSRSHRSERSRRSESPPHRSSHSHRTPRESDRRSQHNDNKSSRQHRLSPPEPSVNRRRKSPTPPTLRPVESDDESDPLEDLVGPLPANEAPVRSRGRGAYKANTSNIDSHFASDYNPALDIQPDHDDERTATKATRRAVSGLMTGDDDWDTAMEALRDRARWRQKGEERLRAAGIGEETIGRWKTESAPSSGVTGERDVEDVRWSKKGEGREWDRGKFVDDDGHIGVRAAWP
ncbi:hypothetical protein N7466_005955 [Penicillium verhagenii]|uniref:uncharacterized protein n=1 Tax=Penicillium verhagenii TaxID=1562060 RepID=UPI002545601C|nr:uncharacterized protein N7466_005955 [Penicillium verhagenii]KAJ5930462.1 hypothetical protein N7466_005955 [Penicillium verhagenii]